jgi:hypothetical protein
MTPSGNVRCRLKTPYRDGTTHVIFEPLDFMARLAALVPRPRVTSPVSTGVRPEQPALRPGHPGQAGQGQQGQGIRRTANARRTAGLDDPGAAPQAGVPHRHSDLPDLRGAMNVIRHQAAASDCARRRLLNRLNPSRGRNRSQCPRIIRSRWPPSGSR